MISVKTGLISVNLSKIVLTYCVFTAAALFDVLAGSAKLTSVSSVNTISADFPVFSTACIIALNCSAAVTSFFVGLKSAFKPFITSLNSFNFFSISDLNSPFNSVLISLNFA